MSLRGRGGSVVLPGSHGDGQACGVCVAVEVGGICACRRVGEEKVVWGVWCAGAQKQQCRHACGA